MARFFQQKWVYRVLSATLLAVPLVAIPLSIEWQSGNAIAYAELASSIPDELVDDLLTANGDPSDAIADSASAPIDPAAATDYAESEPAESDYAALDDEMLDENASIDDDEALIASSLDESEAFDPDQFSDLSWDDSVGDLAWIDAIETSDHTDQ